MALIIDTNLSLDACTWRHMCLYASVWISLYKYAKGNAEAEESLDFRDSPPTNRKIRLEDRTELYVWWRSKLPVRSDSERKERSLFSVIYTSITWMRRNSAATDL